MTLDVLNPATERPIAHLERAGIEETDRAVAAARGAFPAWLEAPARATISLPLTLRNSSSRAGPPLPQPR